MDEPMIMEFSFLKASIAIKMCFFMLTTVKVINEGLLVINKNPMINAINKLGGSQAHGSSSYGIGCRKVVGHGYFYVSSAYNG